MIFSLQSWFWRWKTAYSVVSICKSKIVAAKCRCKYVNFAATNYAAATRQLTSLQQTDSSSHLDKQCKQRHMSLNSRFDKQCTQRHMSLNSRFDKQCKQRHMSLNSRFDLHIPKALHCCVQKQHGHEFCSLSKEARLYSGLVGVGWVWWVVG